jgi:hypothetical protein
MPLCISNISNELTEARLNSLLIEYGSVKQIHLSPVHQKLSESYSAVVEMETATQEKAVTENLEGRQCYSRALTVNQYGLILPIQIPLESKKHTCPCCSYPLLRHITSRGIHWRCGHCYQEMPII